MTEMEMMAAMGLPTALGGGGGAAAHPAPQKADPTRCKAAAWADESERPCKQCQRSLSAIMYTPKQWTKAAPCCIDCAFELRMAGLDDGADGGAERVVATTDMTIGVTVNSLGRILTLEHCPGRIVGGAAEAAFHRPTAR